MQFPTQAQSNTYYFTTRNSAVTLESGGLEVNRYIIHWARLDQKFNSDAIPLIDNTSLELRCNNTPIARLLTSSISQDYFLNYVCDGSIKVYASSSVNIFGNVTLTYTEYIGYGLNPNVPQDYYLNTQFSYGEIIIGVFTFLIFCTLIYKFLWDTIKRKKIK